MFDQETANLFASDLNIAYESDMQSFYDAEYIAIEGFGADFKDNVNAYMSNIQEINSAIPKAIADGNPEKIRDLCHKGVRLCEEFRNDLKKLPKDKFGGIRNLMPCFKTLMILATTAMYCGGAKAIGKLPIMKPLVNAGQKLVQFGEDKRGQGSIGNRAIGFGQRRIKDAVLLRFPLVHQFVNANTQMPELSKFEKVWKGVSYARQLYGVFKQIRGIVIQVMNENKYAKMVRDEDKNDQNKGNRKYMAMLGQIEEMIGMFKSIAEDADNLVAGNKDAKATEGLSVYVELFGLEGTLDIIMESYLEPAMEAISVTGYDKVYKKWAPIFNAINENIISAIMKADMDGVKKYCDQGIHSMRQMKDDVKKLPPDAWGKIKNFIPSADTLNSICAVIGQIDRIKSFKNYYFSTQTFRNMIRNGVAGAIDIRESLEYQDITDAEFIHDVATIIDTYNTAYRVGRASLNVAMIAQALKGWKNIVGTMRSKMAKSSYGNIIAMDVKDDPNVGNKKYRITMNQIDTAIAMYNYIKETGIIPKEGMTVVTESWLIDQPEKSTCWLA